MTFREDFEEDNKRIWEFLNKDTNCKAWHILLLVLLIMSVSFIILNKPTTSYTKYVQVCNQTDGGYTSEDMRIDQFFDSLTKIKLTFWNWVVIVLILLLVIKS